jgi:MarR family 2-MHQ and catechol resistance regulon transcriptional repressor
MEHRPTQKEKTQRAFRAYLDLIDTAKWMRGELRGQLESFDLTMGGFRVLEMLYRKGPVSVPVAAARRGCKRQNLDVIIAQLEERGWVGRTMVTYPAAEIQESHIPKARRGQPRAGRRVGVVSLTRLGRKFIGNVFPRHAKMVKALMRALGGREQESLSRLCRKLRKGDVLRFISEITHEEVDEEG